MKNALKKILIAFAGLSFLSGCVVYDTRPRVYAYPAYEVYDGPTVVYVRGGYGYHHWR